VPCGTSTGVLLEVKRIEVVNRLRKDMVLATISNYSVDYDARNIYSRVHHHMNELCSINNLDDIFIKKFDTLDDALSDALQEHCNLWAPGIEIVSVRVTKPRIPESIRRNYEAFELEKSKLLVAVQEQRVRVQEAQTESKRAIIEANKIKSVSQINSEKRVSEKRASAAMNLISIQTELARDKAFTDAEFCTLLLFLLPPICNCLFLLLLTYRPHIYAQTN
jgi:regulator of protease activity HflC (stomatin/prohibitin superfamily)